MTSLLTIEQQEARLRCAVELCRQLVALGWGVQEFYVGLEAMHGEFLRSRPGLTDEILNILYDEEYEYRRRHVEVIDPEEEARQADMALLEQVQRLTGETDDE